MRRAYMPTKGVNGVKHKYSEYAGFFSGLRGIDKKRAETDLPTFMDCAIRGLKSCYLEKLCRIIIGLPKRERGVLIDEYGLRGYIETSLNIDLGKRPKHYETPKSRRHLLIELAGNSQFERFLQEGYNSLTGRKAQHEKIVD